MKRSSSITATLSGIACATSFLPTSFAAPTVQLITGVESSKFVDGLNITDRKPAFNLSAEVSLDNGSFAGLDCYKTETIFFQDGIDSGCNYYVGYFAPLNNSQALSATLSRGEYAIIPGPGRQWDYTTLALNWHTSRSTVFTLSTTDDWLGRGYSAISLSAVYEHPVTERWSASVEASYIDFGGLAPVNAIDYARLGLRYGQDRWSGELNLHLSDSDLNQLITFDVQQPDFSVGINYRFY